MIDSVLHSLRKTIWVSSNSSDKSHKKFAHGNKHLDKSSVTEVLEHDSTRPKRPLCAYNIFFQEQRKVILANRPVRPEGSPRHSHGKMGFAEMAKTILGAMWKCISVEDKTRFQQLAQLDKQRYERAMEQWNGKKSGFLKDTCSLLKQSTPSVGQVKLINMNKDELFIQDHFNKSLKYAAKQHLKRQRFLVIHLCEIFV
ncbi:hypothetical protein ACA910_002801 [Epithemia clementina (nom. ined.)]